MLRSRWRVAIVVCLAGAGYSGCAPAPVPARAKPKPKPPAPAPAEIWQRFEGSRSWPTSTKTWFISEGHYAGTSEALVHVTPGALERYRGHSLGSTFDPGTAIVMLHRKRSNRTPGPVHVMVRGERDWEFLVLDARGAIRERGQLPLCQRCHAEAVSDSVFGAAAPDSPE